MKSSRRKQTNPNRVAAGRDPNAIAPQTLPEGQFPASEPVGDADDAEMRENPDTNSDLFEENSDGTRPMGGRGAEFPLDMTSGGVGDLAPGEMSPQGHPDPRHSPGQRMAYLGPSEGSTADFHKRHASTDLGPPASPKRPRLDVAEASRERDEEEPRDFPTAYHRLGRELQGTSAEPPVTNGHVETPPGEAQSPRGSATSPSQLGAEQQHPGKQMSMQSAPSPTSYPEFNSAPHQLPPIPGSTTPNNKDGGAGDPQSGTLNNNGKSDRIFHMDAYCDLCDREFCNKYFLKTHKANKHGIYEDNSPPASGVPLPFPGMMMPQDPLMSFNFKMDGVKPQLPQGASEPLAPWSFKLDSSSQPKKPPEGIARPADSPSLPLFPMSMPFPPSMDSPRPPSKSGSEKLGEKLVNGLPPSQSPSSSSATIFSEKAVESSPTNNNTSNSTSILTSITNSIKSNTNSNSNPPATDTSMEDYCHICQKHFCNKYYLKKHKQDVHGIAPETPPNSTTKRARSSASSSLLDHPLGLSSHNAPSPFNLPQPLASLAGMHGLSGMPGLPGMPGMPGLPGMPILPNMPSMPNMPPGVMVINPYSLPPMALLPGSQVPGQQLPPPPHHPIGMTPLPDSALLPPPPTSSSSSSSSSNNHANSSTSAGKPSPSIQDGGVHCNICSKEFCNEFYLQIHKESKHGVRRGSEDQAPPRDKATPLMKDTKHEHSTSGRPSPPPLARSVTPKTEASSNAPVARSPTEHRSSSSASGTSSLDERLMVCNLCSKEFTNKYLYRIHRIHDHGLNELVDPTLTENGEMPNKEDAMRNMNESLRKMGSDPSAVSQASSFRESLQGTNIFTTKLSPHHQEQNAVCDICNKEMTNQYFLRLHKFNVHGIDPTTNEKYDNKKIGFSNSPSPSNKPKTPPTSGGGLPPASPSQPPQPLNLTPHHPGKHPMLPFFPPKIDFKDMPPFADFHKFRDMPSFLNDTINNELFARAQNPTRHMDLNFFGLPSLGKIPEDNVKLNFDPEAYCEICKKEFCSKYFLRTHKQNIHGIKSDPLPGSLPKTSSLDLDKMHTPIKPSISSSSLNGGNSLSSISARPRGGNGGPGAADLDKNSWRWKEPVNSSRVVCDICNKEVCNKYFLRTHKLKKHGIPLSAQSPSVSVSGSPVASDCDSASNASSLPEEKPSPLSMFRSSDPFNLPQMIPLPPSDTTRLSDKYQLKQSLYGPGGKVKDEFQAPLSNNNNNNIPDSQQSETCNICSKRFKSLKWLKDHILKDHHISPPAADAALDMRSSTSTGQHIITKSGVSYNNSNKDAPVYTCQVCRANFPAELSVQLHLIQEHNARVTLDTEPEPRLPDLPSEERQANKASPRVAELSSHWGPRRKASPATWSSAAACRVKKFVCTRCDSFSSSWLSSLIEHERAEHGLANLAKRVASPDQASVPGFSCRHCSLSCPSPNALSAHLVTVHALSVEAAVNQAKDARVVFLPPSSVTPSPPNCFRCSRCPAVFPTRAWGVAHVRHVHIRSRRDLKQLRRVGCGRSNFQMTTLQCPCCSFKSHFSSRMQRHVIASHGKAAWKSFNLPKNGDAFTSPASQMTPAPFVAAASTSSNFSNMGSVILSTYNARSNVPEPNLHPGMLRAPGSSVAAPVTLVSQGHSPIAQTYTSAGLTLQRNMHGSPNCMVNGNNDEDDDDDAIDNSPSSALANDDGPLGQKSIHQDDDDDDEDDEDDDDDDDDESGLVSTSGVYQSIAASLLSAPASDGRANGRQASPDDSPSPPSTPDAVTEGPGGREGSAAATFLQGFRHQIPLGSTAVDTSPFKMASQTSAASAVVGGL